MNYSIESKIKLKRSQKEVWELISTPGILKSVHPFCKENKVKNSTTLVNNLVIIVQMLLNFY